MKRLLLVLLTGFCLLQTAKADVVDSVIGFFKRDHYRGIPEEQLLNVDWTQVIVANNHSVFARTQDLKNNCSDGLWTRAVPRDGGGDVFEHFHTDCSGNNLVIQDAEIKVSIIDDTLKRRNTGDPVENPDKADAIRQLLCKSSSTGISSYGKGSKVKRSRTEDDFVAVQYRENGQPKTLDLCRNGRKTYTTFEQLKGNTGGSTDIAACQTTNGFAPWLAVKRENFNITRQGRQTSDVVYRIGNNCQLVNAGSGAKKWDCQTLNEVNSMKINTVEPITNKNRNDYFAPVWVKVNKYNSRQSPNNNSNKSTVNGNNKKLNFIIIQDKKCSRNF